MYSQFMMHGQKNNKLQELSLLTFVITLCWFYFNRAKLQTAYKFHNAKKPPKEGVLRIFSPLKNPTASAGFEPANLGTKGHPNYAGL